MREFIEQLRSNGKVTDIRHGVSREFEAPRIAKKIQGPVLFHDIEGKKAIMNLLGTRDELAAMFGVPRDKIIQKLSEVQPDGEVVVVPGSPTMEIVDEEVDLYSLPIMKHFAKDGGLYITAGIVVSEYEGTMNASIHRLMVLGKDKLAARLVPP
ncbi:MAG: UbiD family decarboxylase, partial [Methanomethylovorans sp.]